MSGQRRYFHGGDQAGNRKRRRVSSETPEIEDRLESLIVRVGEKSTSSLESNLEGLASVLEADLPSFKHKILRIMADCAVRMPEKCSIYSTLVGLINVKNYNFGGEFVELMVRNFKDALKTCHWDEARYGVRFLSDLVNCHVVSASSLMQLYHNLLEVIWEEGVPTVRKDWYSYVVLSSLPWVGRELYEKKEPELDKLLTNIGKYVDQRDKLSVDALRVWSVDEPHPQEEYLDCLWAQIQKMKTDLWQEKHIARPYLSFDSVLCEALQHNLTPVLPPPHQPEYHYPLPWVVFRLFDYTDCPEGPILPGAHSIERYLIEEQLHNVIEQFHMERKECAARLLSYPNRQQIPLDYMIVEVMLSELFGLPSNRYLDICYGSIMIELCKLQPSTMPQVLAQATELLYERLANMNTCCFERFVSWFSYHLSNFQFRWSWEDWSDCLQLETEHPKQKFVREVLYKSLRLSYYQCIVEIVPENFHDLVPPTPVPSFKYKFDSEEDLAANPGAETVKQMVNLIRSKCTPDQLLVMLKEVPNPEGQEAPCNPLAIDYLVQTLLFMGSKSFSHSFAALAKFHAVFKSLLETEEAQICCLKSLHSFWGQNIQVSVLIDKMLKTSIIHCSAVATWLFSKDMQEEFTKHYVWEVLHLTIRKMNRHVTKLETEVSEAREKIQHVDSESSESDSDMMSNKRRRVDPPEKVTPEMIEKMEEQLELAQADQKNLYLIIFQRFIMLLTEHIVRCDTDGRDFNTHWYHWISGRLNQVFMLHMDQVWKYKDTLETLLFTHDLDPHILKLFQQFCALKV